MSYYFDFDYDDGRVPERYLQPVRRGVLAWWRARHDDVLPRLDADVADDTVIITDTRAVAVAARHELTGVAARVTDCDSAKPIATLRRDSELAEHEDDVRAASDTLLAAHLLICDKDRYLSLAVMRKRPTAGMQRCRQHGLRGCDT